MFGDVTAQEELLVTRKYRDRSITGGEGEGGGTPLLISLQGYLAHKKTPNPLEPPKDPRHRLR